MSKSDMIAVYDAVVEALRNANCKVYDNDDDICIDFNGRRYKMSIEAES